MGNRCCQTRETETEFTGEQPQGLRDLTSNHPAAAVIPPCCHQMPGALCLSLISAWTTSVRSSGAGPDSHASGAAEVTDKKEPAVHSKAQADPSTLTPVPRHESPSKRIVQVSNVFKCRKLMRWHPGPKRQSARPRWSSCSFPSTNPGAQPRKCEAARWHIQTHTNRLTDSLVLYSMWVFRQKNPCLSA